MATPTPRAALVTGKAFAADIRAVAQAVVVVVVAALLGVSMTWNPLELLGVGSSLSGLLVFCLPAGRDRGNRAQTRSIVGHRADNHHATVLCLQRAVLGRTHADVGSVAQPH